MRMERGLDFCFLDNLRNQNNNNNKKPFSLYIPLLVGGHFLTLVKWRGRDVRIMI